MVLCVLRYGDWFGVFRVDCLVGMVCFRLFWCVWLALIVLMYSLTRLVCGAACGS